MRNMARKRAACSRESFGVDYVPSHTEAHHEYSCMACRFAAARIMYLTVSRRALVAKTLAGASVCRERERERERELQLTLIPANARDSPLRVALQCRNCAGERETRRPSGSRGMPFVFSSSVFVFYSGRGCGFVLRMRSVFRGYGLRV